MTADHHHAAELAPIEARVAAIESVLVDNRILDVDALDAIVANFEDNLGPMNGAKVVARAWSDPAYKERLLADGTEAIRELGFEGRQGEFIDAGAATEVVQGAGLPLTGRARTPQAAHRDGNRDPR